jgi:putative hydrolase of the HAD superfamily
MNCVLFDLDDTLIDRQATVSAFALPFIEQFRSKLQPNVCTKTLRENLITIDRGGYALHSERAISIQSLPIWQQSPPTQEQLSNYWQQWIPNHSVLMNGAKKCLSDLRSLGYSLGVVTNGKTRNQSDKLRSSGLDSYFDCIVISENVGVKKPDAAIFELALTQLGCNANDAFFVGDHLKNDYLGALEAGLNPIWFQGRQAKQTEGTQPELVIQTLGQLIEVVKRNRVTS